MAIQKKSAKAVKKLAAKASKKRDKAIADKPADIEAIPAENDTTVIRALVKQAETEKTTLDTVYLINASDKQVTLEVNVGAQGQTSDMTIKLDNTIIIKNKAGDFPEASIGSNKQLNGKKLSLIATITDTSKDTNFTSLTIHLKGGLAAQDFPLFKTVDEEGDSEDYLCLIEFFNPLT